MGEPPADVAPSVAALVDAVDGVGQPVALVLDDVHHLTPGSAGAGALAELIEALPACAHLVVAGRGDPPLPLARLVAERRVEVIGPAELLFTAAEVAEVAEVAPVPLALFGELDGWPALVRLTADGHAALVGRYVDDEVVGSLAPAARRTLQTLVALGGADDDLLAAVCEGAVSIPALTMLVPLVANDHGWARPAALWGRVPSVEVADAVGRELRGRGIEVLAQRDDLDAAIRLALRGSDWPTTAKLLARACASGHYRHGPDRLRGWLDQIPADRHAEPVVALLEGIDAKTSGARAEVAERWLQAAIEGYRAAGDDAGEMTGIAVLGHAIWTRGDAAGMAGLFQRVLELEAAGSATAAAFANLGRAALADAAGDDAAVLAQLDTVDESLLDDDWSAVAQWFRCKALLMSGRPDEALPAALRASELGGEGFAAARSIVSFVLFCSGRLEDLLGDYAEEAGAAVRILGGSVSRRDQVLGRALIGAGYRLIGFPLADDELLPPTDPRDVGQVAVIVAAEVVAAVARGAEADAAARLYALTTTSGFSVVELERALRYFVGILYPLAPAELVAQWDAEDLGPSLRERRELGRQFLAQRAGGPEALDPADRWPTSGTCLTALGARWCLELAAVGLAAGHPDARRLLDDLAAFLSASTQDGLHDLTGHDHPDVRRAVTRYLAERPFPPRRHLEVRVLGPLELRRGGDVVDEPAWRRERVRSLFSYLLEHGTATREQLAGQLWPELDERAGANNLRVTLSYLLAILEPERAAGDASWFVRTDGNAVRLVPGEGLWVDRTAFEAKLDEAARRGRDGAHSLELVALEAALDLWRGEPFTEHVYDEWAELARVRLRQRYVEAALRAAELHGAAGDRLAAVRHARAALAVEPWSERAFRVLIAVALAAGDRAGALRALEECRSMLADLGLTPAPQTLDLAVDARGDDGPALSGPAAG
jgi:DNA-binding SARP family transcriptional activator